METLSHIRTWHGSYLLCRPPHNKDSDGELLSGFEQSLFSWQKKGVFRMDSHQGKEGKDFGGGKKAKKKNQNRFQSEQDEQVSGKEIKGKTVAGARGCRPGAGEG